MRPAVPIPKVKASIYFGGNKDTNPKMLADEIDVLHPNKKHNDPITQYARSPIIKEDRVSIVSKMIDDSPKVAKAL